MSNEEPQSGPSQQIGSDHQDGSSSQPGNPQPVHTAMWFMGASWVSKFCGDGGAERFVKWRAQVEAFLRAQELNLQQRIDFVLNSLDSMAHQQSMLLALTDRDTDKKILDMLKRKYGGNTSSDHLRA